MKYAKKAIPENYRKSCRKNLSRIVQNYYYNALLRQLSINDHRKRFILMATPEHGNLGDHAIVESEILFLSDTFPDHRIIEISESLVSRIIENNINIIKDDDLLIINGGGYLGSLWQGGDRLVRSIVQSFPHNKIVIFPQTIYYENIPLSSELIESAKLIYGKHRKLTLFAREKQSYELMKRVFMNNKVHLAPDIVLYLKKPQKHNRKSVLLCIRKDKESILTQEEKRYILNITKSYSSNVAETDTNLLCLINNKRIRCKLLEQKYREFAGAQLVITDRLHGMLFAVVTGTPCIALNNLNNKVKGVYEWIRHLDYVKYIENVVELKDCIMYFSQKSPYNYFNNDYLMSNFDLLKTALTGGLDYEE